MSVGQKLAKNIFDNYVYLYKDNYMREVGTEKPQIIFRSVKKGVSDNINRKKSNAELNKLAATYNKGRNILLGIASPEAQLDSNRYQTLIVEALNEKLGYDLDLNNIDFATLAIQNLSSTNLISRIRKIRKRGENASNNYQTVKSRIDKLKTSINAASDAIKNMVGQESSLEKLKKAAKEIEKLETILDSIFNQTMSSEDKKSLTETFKAMGLPKPASLSKALSSVTGRRMDNEAANLIRRALNTIIIHSIKGSQQLILGDLFEVFGYAAFLLGTDVAEDIVDEKITTFFKQNSGSQHSKGELILTGTGDVVRDVLNQINNINIPQGTGLISTKISYSSQKKADFIVTIDDQEYGISAKNYKDVQFKGNSRYISLEKGSPLLFHLLGANELHPLASRAFLNILAGNSKEDVRSRGYAAVKKQGLETLQFLLLWQMMTGEGVGKSTGFANILAWNDNKTGLVRFYDMNTILNSLQHEDLNALKIFSPSLREVQLNNTKVYAKKGISSNSNKKNKESVYPGIKMRLSRILREAHAQKIGASIPMEYLKKQTAAQSST